MTGVQTCALPILGVEPTRGKSPRDFKSRTSAIPSARHSGSNPSLLSSLPQDNPFCCSVVRAGLRHAQFVGVRDSSFTPVICVSGGGEYGGGSTTRDWFAVADAGGCAACTGVVSSDRLPIHTNCRPATIAINAIAGLSFREGVRRLRMKPNTTPGIPAARS